MKRTLMALLLLTVPACLQDTSSLESSGRGFLSSLGYKVVGVSCMNMDSDGDGYVSCTARVEGQQQPVAIECASAYSFKSGCRMQKLSNLRGE